MNTPLKLFTFLVIAFPFLTSCGDDEEIIDREPLIIGTWTLESQDVVNVKASAAGINDLPVDDLVSSFVDTLAIIPENSEFTFKQDRTYTVETPRQASDFSGTWELSDDQSTVTLSGLDAAEDLLGSNNLVFVIQSINATSFSVITSVPEITLPDFPTLGSVKASGDYQLNLGK